MRAPRVWIVLTLAAVLVCALLNRAWPHSSEPTYEGRTVTAWIKVLGAHERNARLRDEVFFKGGDVRTRPVRLGKGLATDALRVMGPPAVPYFTNVLAKPDGGLGSRYWKFYLSVNPRWRRLLLRPPIDALCLRRAAVSALGEMKDAAKSAWPALLAATDDSDPETRRQALEVLQALSKRDTEVNMGLCERLLTTNLAQAQVLAVVERYGLRAPPAIQALVRVARNGSTDVREAALTQLREIGQAAGAAAPYLFSALSDTNHTVRCRACQALGAIQPDAAQTVPSLIAVLDDADSLVRASAANALAAYGTRAAAAVPRLTELFKTKDGVEKYCFGRALSQVDPVAAAKAGAE